MATTPKRLADVDRTASADVSSANMLCVSGGHVKQLPGYIQQIDKNKSDIEAIMLKIYPVGAIYISVSNINPSTLFGGTWEQIKGRFLLGAGDSYTVGSTGGEATHTLSVNEMPSHRHSSDSFMNGYAANSTDPNNYCTWVNHGTTGTNAPATGENGTIKTSYVGGSAAHNNMPPYLAVYMWKRTA